MKKHLIKEDIEAKVLNTTFFNTNKTVVCILTLENSYEVVGEAGIIDPEKFNLAIGRKIAYQNALEKVWQLEGYLLEEILATNKENNN